MVDLLDTKPDFGAQNDRHHFLLFSISASANTVDLYGIRSIVLKRKNLLKQLRKLQGHHSDIKLKQRAHKKSSTINQMREKIKTM